MGKGAEAEMAEAEAPTNKSKKVKALVDTVAGEAEPEAPKKEKKNKKQKTKVEEPAEEDEVETEARKKEKKRKKQEQAAAEAEATPEGAVDADEEKKKRKEEKKKRKQAAIEAVAEAEEEDDFAQAEAEAAAAEAPTKKKKIAAGAEPDAKTSENKPVPPAFVHIDELTVFVGGLPFTCTLDALRKEFSKCGEIQCLKLPGNLKGNRGIAFITYASKEGAGKAIKLDGDDYGGRTLRVNLAGEKRPEKVKEAKEGKVDYKGNGKGNRAFQVFVGGLPFQATEVILRKDFGECGEIHTFSMPLNEEGKPRGILFITYATQEGVDKALAFHNTDYGGRTLTVNKVGEGKGKGKDGKDKGKGGGKGKSQTFEDDGDE